VIYSTTPTTPASSAVTVKISKSGSRRVRLTDTGDGCEIDNISFNAPTNNAASIAGTLWHDLDGDKIIDTGEPKLSGWTVFLDKDNDGVLDSGETSKLTDASGNYKFTLLAAGSYHVARSPRADGSAAFRRCPMMSRCRRARP